MPPAEKKGLLARIWDYFFNPRRRVRCPYCLKYSRLHRSDANCQNPACGRTLPDLYLAECDRMPPLFVPVLGWTGCGKTWSLFSMINTLEKMTKVWGEYTCQVAETGSLTWLRNFVRVMMFGTSEDREKLDKGTPPGIQPAYIFLLNYLPQRWRGRDHTGRTLILRDFAGEIFSGEGKYEAIPPDQLSFIAEAEVVMLMFSLTDLTPGKAMAVRSMDQLLANYVISMVRQIAKEKNLDFPTAQKKFREAKRKVIVTLGRADELKDDNKLPTHLSNYLADDPIDKAIRGDGFVNWSEKEMGLYLEKLDRASDAIREYLEHRYPDAQQMVRIAAQNNIQIKFCLTTATGPVKLSGPASEARLEPQRILDPLLAALKFGEVPRPTTV